MNGVNTVEEIKSRCNIVDVIGKVVTLKKAGSNYKGLCPFHNEKTPSFVVSETKQIFTCFGCGASGDVISFTERYYNLDFKGAVEMLAKEYGVEISHAFGGGKKKDELYEINRKAAVFFYKALRSRVNPGYTYMKQRGISEGTMNKFGIGYADGQWTSLMDYMEKEGVSRDHLLKLGLISGSGGRYYDKFRNRVIFPIIDVRGRVIGFGGRILGDGMPKYLNSPESEIFLKKNNLYGLNLAKDEIAGEDRVVLVEGYMDVVSLYQSGVRNVCASLGTALTENQARLLKRYTKNVILSYDADEAGQNAAMRGIDVLYREDLKAKVLRVTDGKDPDEFVKKNGKRAFAQLMDEALPYGDFKIRRIGEKYDLNDEQQRLDYLREVIGALRPMKPVEADMYLNKIAEQTGISQQAIRLEYQNAPQEDAAGPTRLQRESEASGEIGEAEKNLLKLMLLDRRYANLPEDVRKTVFRDGAAAELFRTILEHDTGSGPMNLRAIGDGLDPELYELAASVDDLAIPQEKEQGVYDECIRYIRNESLKARDQEITWQLSLADGNLPDDEIADLMREQAEIQKKLKGQGA